MKRGFWTLGVAALLTVAAVGCGKDAEAALEPKAPPVAVGVDEDAEETDDRDVTGVATVSCGTVYEDDALLYNVFGLRTKTYDDGTEYLLIQLEVYNHSSAPVNYSPMGRLDVVNGEGDYCSLAPLAAVDGDLGGTIAPENKLMGEVAFDITGAASDRYTLHVGEGYDLVPAIDIVAADFDKTFETVFESKGIDSAYTIGVPVESKQLTITLNGAEVDVQDREILLLDIAVANNSDAPVNFMGGINLNGVYTEAGEQLEVAVNPWTFPNDAVAAGETATGILAYYIEGGERAFYMTVTPDLNAFSEKAMIVFETE